MPLDLPISTRRARLDDLPILQAIYNFYSMTTAAMFGTPPSLQARRDHFRRHFSVEGPHQMWVAVCDEETIGFAWSLPCPDRPGEVLTSIYCAPHATGRGVGTRLYTDLLHAVGRHATAAWAGITLPNPASVALHRRLGFVARFVQRDYAIKLGRTWDLGWFRLDPAARRPVRPPPRMEPRRGEPGRGVHGAGGGDRGPHRPGVGHRVVELHAVGRPLVAGVVAPDEQHPPVRERRGRVPDRFRAP